MAKTNAPSRDNSEQNSGPVQDPETGRWSGGNPGNSGGKPGRSGRKPDAYKALLQSVLDDPKHAEAVRAVLTDGDHKHFPSVQKTAIEHVHGKPTQSHQFDGDLTIRVVFGDE